MGKFHRILEPGLAILIPFIDKIQYVKSLKEVAIEIPSQSAITADNVTLELDVRLYVTFKICLVGHLLIDTVFSRVFCISVYSMLIKRAMG